MKKRGLARPKSVLIFSDTHLTHTFDRPKFEYLKKRISEVDQVIINGDFWDYYLTTWDKFINSDWKALFPLLKSKKAIYIYGNHDQKSHSDERVNLFSVTQTYQYVLELPGKKLHIEHGHLIAPTLDLRFSKVRNKPVMWLAEKMEEYNVLFLSQMVVNFFAKRENKHMKEFLAKHLSPQDYLICGHTHFAEFRDGSRFINTGWIRYKTAQALQIRNGVFSFLNDKY